MAWKPPNVSGAEMSSEGYFKFKRSNIRNGGGRWPEREGVLEADVNLSMSMRQTGEESVQRLMLQRRLGGGVVWGINVNSGVSGIVVCGKLNSAGPSASGSRFTDEERGRVMLAGVTVPKSAPEELKDGSAGSEWWTEMV